MSRPARDNELLANENQPSSHVSVISHQHDEVVKYLQSVVNLDHVLRCLDSQRQRDRNVSTVRRMLDRVRRLTRQLKNVRHRSEN